MNCVKLSDKIQISIVCEKGKIIMTEEKKKKCFIITPIGEEGTDIRRHIDGIIDAALIPVLEENFDYELEVAHRIDAPGNIPKQVIMSIFNSDLVIANLTGNNPNVMYELALRHCFGTAVIVIAEIGTKIPADIMGERTIFYVNDAQGVIDLKSKLENMVQRIQEVDKIKQAGPVYDALKEELDRGNVIEKISVSENANAFTMILKQLDLLQKEIRKKDQPFNENKLNIERFGLLEYILTITCNTQDSNVFARIIYEDITPFLEKMNVEYRWNKTKVNSARLVIKIFDKKQLSIIEDAIREAFKENGIYGVSIMEGTREIDRI